jgi:hypothetical protein
MIFSFVIEQNDYCQRLEQVISQILNHPTLQHCILHTARPVTFSKIESPSSVIYLELNSCSLQSLYTLFEFTPNLRHLTARITIYEQLNTEKIPKFPKLNSLTLALSFPVFDDLNSFLQNFPKLQKLTVITYSGVIEPLTFTATWFKFITEHLSALTKFKREGNVALENTEEYVELFHWPNGWKLEEMREKNGENYYKITVINTRY